MMMSVVRVDVRDVLPSTFAYVHSSEHSFDLVYFDFVRMLILMKVRSSLKMSHFGSKTRSLDQIKSQENLVYTLQGTVLIQSSRNFVRMLILIKSRSSSIQGHVGSKPR